MKNSIKFCMVLISLLSIKTIFTEDKEREDSQNNEGLSKYITQEQRDYFKSQYDNLKKQHEFFVEKIKEANKKLTQEMEHIEHLIEEGKPKLKNYFNVIIFKLAEFKNNCKNFMNTNVDDKDSKILCLCS